MLHGWDKLVDVDGDQIETVLENNQCYTMRETVDILKISASSIGNHLCQLGYVNCFDVWYPPRLGQKKKKKILDHFSACNSLLKPKKAFHF